MRVLIDGYNLLHASGVFATETGPDTLQQSRQALLDALADLLDPRLIKQTLVVFDAAGAPPGLPRAVHRGLVIRYASPQADADQLIEELIEAHRAPRDLLVVSSDHRLHRAARRRGATSIDSEAWFGELSRHARARLTREASDPGKKEHAPSNSEVQYWLRQFGIDHPEDFADDPTAPRDPASPRDPAAPRTASTGDDATTPPDSRPDPWDEPIFPPGYGEDLLEDE